MINLLYHHLIFSITKTTFALEEPKKFVYRDYKAFSQESIKNDSDDFGRLPNHTSQTNIHMVASKVH